MKTVRVWDLPVRLFHWTLAALIVVAVVTQNIGGNAMQWHFLAGYAALALILFRIVWGLVGTRYARFSSFMRGPAAIIDYVRGVHAADACPGHNPLGGLSVLALLGVVLLQAVTGLFANDDIASEGPLVKFISKDWSDQITWFHKEVSANLIYALVGLHVAAIAFYYVVKKRNLVKPMVTGDSEIVADAPAANDTWKTRLLALVLFAACAAAVYFVVNLKAAQP